MNRLYSICRCCGLREEEEYYFYDSNRYGTLAICSCCACQSGNNDFNLENLFSYRHHWETGRLHWQNGDPNLWFDEAIGVAKKPREWNKQEQMQNIPRYMLINPFPIFILTPQQRKICRICGYEAQEQDFFYDARNCATHNQCPSCGGESGCDDVNLQSIYRYRHCFINPTEFKDKTLQFQQIPQEFLQNLPSYIPTPQQRKICRICGYEAHGEDLLYDERGDLMEMEEQDFFYDAKGYPTYRYCPCCGGESGYDDFDLKDILRRRYFWMKNLGNKKPSLIITREGRIFLEEIKNKHWTLQSQLQNIPQQFLTPSPSYIPTPQQRKICRICGYEAHGEDLLYDERGDLMEMEEQDFFYDAKGYPTYRYCPCCGGQSGYDDFDTQSLLARLQAWKAFNQEKP